MRVFTELPPADWRSVGPVARTAELAGFDAPMPILAMHGLEELGHKLQEMSVQGKSSEMAQQISAGNRSR